MKVLLINPPFLFFKKSDIILSHCLGLLYIASYLREHHNNVQIIDALQKGLHSVKKLDKNQYKVGLDNKLIIDAIPDDTEIIGISVPFSHMAKLAHQLIREIKETYPHIPIVMGGVYPSSQPELAIQSDSDYIVLGEGEVPLQHIIDHLSGKEKIAHASIIEKGADITGKESYYMKDVNSLPLPARDLIDFSNYTIRSPRNVRGWNSASIITSKGCPFDCEFCSVHPVCGYRWRPFTAAKVLEEIDELIDNYQVNNIEIEDDNFTIKIDRVEEILDGLIKRNNNNKFIAWQALNGLRIDTLNEKIIKKFKESNCRHINIALENGDPEMLKSIRKKLDLNKVIEVVKLMKRYEIPSHVFTIFGYPGETKERFNNALKYYSEIKRIAPHITFKFFIAQPYPNTKLFKRCVKEGYLPENLFSSISDLNLFSTDKKIWIETEDFDRKEVKRRRKKLERTLYTTSEYMMQKVRDYFPDAIVSRLYSLYHILGKRKMKKQKGLTQT